VQDGVLEITNYYVIIIYICTPLASLKFGRWFYWCSWSPPFVIPSCLFLDPQRAAPVKLVRYLVYSYHTRTVYLIGKDSLCEKKPVSSCEKKNVCSCQKSNYSMTDFQVNGLFLKVKKPVPRTSEDWKEWEGIWSRNPPLLATSCLSSPSLKQ
jgi:hypothetical protein